MTWLKQSTRFINENNLKLLPVQSDSWKTVEWVSPTGEGNHMIYFDNLEAQMVHKSAKPSSPNTGYFASNVVETIESSIMQECKIVRQTLVECGFRFYRMSISNAPLFRRGWCTFECR